jgi:hypothetical protein
MKIIKDKLKHFIQKKVRTLNGSSLDYLSNQFTYIYRAEHLTNCALNSNIPGISSDKYCDNEIIVSLTTYDRRLFEVYLAIESIMQQSLKPNRIVLWLGYELENTEIPIVLKNQQKRGLEINYCKDIKSYKKLIPALKAFPSAVIITIDDDNIYNFDLIENLVNAYKKIPELIFCTKLHRMKLIGRNKLEKYAKWTSHYEKFYVSPLNFPTGNGGILYPPHCFNEEVFNENVFMDICKYADDVWFKAMALLNGVMAQKIFTHDCLSNYNAQHTSLSSINIGKRMNDIQLKAVFDKYNLYERLV